MKKSFLLSLLCTPLFSMEDPNKFMSFNMVPSTQSTIMAIREPINLKNDTQNKLFVVLNSEKELSQELKHFQKLLESKQLCKRESDIYCNSIRSEKNILDKPNCKDPYCNLHIELNKKVIEQYTNILIVAEEEIRRMEYSYSDFHSDKNI
jgi:hypothetical protein